ncbi:hypothetical protein [Streptomyces sp. NPDC055013]
MGPTAGGGATARLLPGEYGGTPCLSRPRPPTGRRQLPVAADIALAVGLLVPDVIGVVAAFLLGIDVSGDWMPFDPGADNSDGDTRSAVPGPTWPYL